MKSLSSSNLSVDSLEVDFKRQSLAKESVEKVDTILVPFYEKDVLIKVPKGPSKKQAFKETNVKKTEKIKYETESPQSYLVNKGRKSRKSSYLEIFRKQFIPDSKQKQCHYDEEIRSLSPEYGDTEQESINETNSPEKEFYNTESYNEMYYEKLMNQEISQYLEKTFEQALHFTENLTSKTPDELNNLKSVSETSHQPRPVRRASVEPVHNIRLGGLGPDIETIKPRLERARSLQRYSEKVRMENRLKIYRKSIEAENERKSARETSARHRSISRPEPKSNQNNSYLVNKSLTEKSPLAKSQTYAKSVIHKRKIEKHVKENNKKNENLPTKSFNPCLNRDGNKTKKDTKKETNTDTKRNDSCKTRVKSSTKTREIKQDKEISSAQHNFLVAGDRIRPSTALRSLEEKHRMFQEKVKAYVTQHGNI